MKKIFYITTPLYYVNYKPHIGHAYTTIAADILARFKRANEEPVFFQTGTDEHGTNIEKIAQKENIQPKQWADEISEDFKNEWKILNINYDYFIRTTDKEHEKQVQLIFEKLISTQDIYLGTYRGLYCSSCENFFEESETVDGNCPVHNEKLESISEETYFFKLSKYEKNLLEHYEKNPDFLSPKHRASEIINFVKSGLKDISVSRTKVAWGIPVLSNPGHTIYVWFDALLNYITGPGFDMENQNSERMQNFLKIWPADVHLVGKEIFRFHTIIWPAMLMALGLALPKKVFAHGWWTVKGEKMSKTRGNCIKPEDITREYGVDAFRYFLFREVPFGQDGGFSINTFKHRYNGDLANGLGNLLSRTLGLVNKCLNNQLPDKPENSKIFEELVGMTKEINSKIENLQFSESLDKIWSVIGRLNKHIDTEKPWEMEKTSKERLKLFLYDMVWCLRLIANWIYPFMPEISTKMQMQLGVGKTKNLTIEPQKSFQLFPRKN